MIIDPCNHEPRSIYKLMTGAIVPRPIAFVSSVSGDGVHNLAPFSFFAGVSADPPVICFCPMIRSSDGKKKDTLHNIEATGEFVVNVVSEELVAQMNICSGEYPPEVDEFALSGLTPVGSDLVKPPRVKEARISMECKLHQIIPVSDRPLGASIVLGEILRFHIQDELLIDFKIDPDRLRAVGRMGGPTYTRTRDRFDLERPKKQA
jgi:flavin reductase (DIM6/NTAB) family NADH-FMN oxidoreductase RutF